MNYYHNTYWRGIVFNKIIKELNYSSYLELGVHTGELCYNIVNCQNKYGVDSNPNINLPNVSCYYTDEYFNVLDKNIKFDLIYIDACHEKYQAYRDFYNSIDHLNENGMIIFHDIYPLTKEHASDTLNGNVYELWIELSKNYPNKTSTFIGFPGDQEGTIGIYFGNEFDKNKINIIDHSYEYFFENITKYIYHKTLSENQIILKSKYNLL